MMKRMPLNFCFLLSLCFQKMQIKYSDVAMVIITTMVAKIYFPESLERGNSGMPQARTFNYRMAEADEDYGSDRESDSGARTDDDADDINEILDSDEEDLQEDNVDGNRREREELLQQDPLAGKRSGPSFANNNFLEFEQMTLSKSEVLKRLSVCVLALNLTFVTWGLLQVCLCSSISRCCQFQNQQEADSMSHFTF
jgi:hypothetical protein